MNVNCLICPVCGEKLKINIKSLLCANNHCFDIAKEGYVNLLSGSHKAGELIGDNKSMALSRKSFLDKGYFRSLSDYMFSIIPDDEHYNVLDICCGEGYYSSVISEKNNISVYGFDISKEMIKLAAKRKLETTFFVANLSKIPLSDECIDFAFHLFAPFNGKEFSRILKKDGRLYTVVPGKEHLYQLKSVLYEKPYYNDEKLPECNELVLESVNKISANIKLNNYEDILALFKMTPYYYHTNENDKAKLIGLNSLETKIEFVIGEYRKA